MSIILVHVPDTPREFGSGQQRCISHPNIAITLDLDFKKYLLSGTFWRMKSLFKNQIHMIATKQE